MWLLALLLFSFVFVVFATGKLNLHPFLVLLVASFGYGLLCGTLTLNEIVEAINNGFGTTMGNIGIIILEGSIIGAFLENSGGARRIAERVMKIIGESRVPLAMNLAGYITSIPVFCDSGFLILSPLGREMSARAGVHPFRCAIALSLGLYATHTMVPPTPGPVGAAGILGADLGLVVLCGIAVSLPASLVGWIFSRFVPFHTPSISEQQEEVAPSATGHSKSTPTITASLFPIIIPIILMLLRSYSTLPQHPLGVNVFTTLIGFFGQPVPALLVGVIFSMFLPEKFSFTILSSEGIVGSAIKSAGPIIIITCAGGSFGKVLQSSGIGEYLSHIPGISDWGIWFPFLTAAALKTAQGSSTVAMITTAGIVMPVLQPLGFDSEIAKSLVVVAVGAGSMIISHANDSYFWIVTQVSRMDVREGYLYQSVGTIVQGAMAGCMVWLLVFLMV